MYIRAGESMNHTSTTYRSVYGHFNGSVNLYKMQNVYTLVLYAFKLDVSLIY